MNIGIIGAGQVGSVLAARLQALGHSVRIANSRSPETLKQLAQDTDVIPTTLSDIAAGVELLIISIPISGVPSLPADLLRPLPTTAPIIDTTNYIPLRDGVIAQIEDGLTESEWVAQTLGRDVIKTFNNVTAHSLFRGGLPAGTPDRIALPIAGNDLHAKQTVTHLVEELGYDPLDAGPLRESWRQQPGTPAYATDLSLVTLPAALAATNRAEAPHMRDVTLQKLMGLDPNTPPQQIIQLARSLWR